MNGHGKVEAKWQLPSELAPIKVGFTGDYALVVARNGCVYRVCRFRKDVDIVTRDLDWTQVHKLEQRSGIVALIMRNGLVIRLDRRGTVSKGVVEPLPMQAEQGRAADITLKEPEKNQWFKCIWETSGKDWQLRVDEISGTWSELLKGYE